MISMKNIGRCLALCLVTTLISMPNTTHSSYKIVDILEYETENVIYPIYQQPEWLSKTKMAIVDTAVFLDKKIPNEVKTIGTFIWEHKKPISIATIHLLGFFLIPNDTCRILIPVSLGTSFFKFMNDNPESFAQSHEIHNMYAYIKN